MEALKNTSMMIILAGIFYGAYQMIVSEPPHWQKKTDSTEVITAIDPSLPQSSFPQQNLPQQSSPPQNVANSTNLAPGVMGSSLVNASPGTSSTTPAPVAFNSSPELPNRPAFDNPPMGNQSLGNPAPSAPADRPFAQAGFAENSSPPPSPSSSMSSNPTLPSAPTPMGLGSPVPTVQPAGHHQPNDRMASAPATGLPTLGAPTSPELLPIHSQPANPSISAPLAGDHTAGDPMSTTQRLKAAMELAGTDIQNNNWSKALRDLSAWYQQPLSIEDRNHLVGWLDRLAGEVIYSTQHTLIAGHQVQPGETLATIAARYQTPPRLLARINQYPDSIAEDAPLQPGVQLKIVPGPFEAEADMQSGQLSLYAGGLYAGRFQFRTGESAPVESLNEPVAFVSVQGIPAQEDQRRHEPLAPTNPFGRYCLVVGQTAVLHSPGGNPQGSCLQFSEQDMLDLMVLLPRGTKVRVVK